MGKWSGHKKTLKPLPAAVKFSDQGGEAYQEKVDGVKAEWSALRDTLQPAVTVELPDAATYEQRCDAVKAVLDTKELAVLCRVYSELRNAKTEIDAVLSEFDLQIEAAAQIIAGRLESLDLTSIKLDSGENFILKDEPYVSVKDKALNRDWFAKNDLGELLTVNWQTLNAFVKEILEHPIDVTTGQPKTLPDGIDIYMKTSISRRKA
jgi:hypothetical protein